MSDDRQFTIGKLSRLAGVGIETIRYPPAASSAPQPERPPQLRFRRPEHAHVYPPLPRARLQLERYPRVARIARIATPMRGCEDNRRAPPRRGAHKAANPARDGAQPDRACGDLPGRRQRRMSGARSAGYRVLRSPAASAGTLIGTATLSSSRCRSATTWHTCRGRTARGCACAWSIRRR